MKGLSLTLRRMREVVLYVRVFSWTAHPQLGIRSRLEGAPIMAELVLYLSIRLQPYGRIVVDFEAPRPCVQRSVFKCPLNAMARSRSFALRGRM